MGTFARTAAVPLLTGVALVLLAAQSAAHGGPDRVVGGKYVVSLALVPASEAMVLRCFFRDLQTGNRVAGPIRYRMRLRDVEAPAWAFDGPRMETRTGIGELRHRFPRNGLYEMVLEFEAPDEPGATLRPEPWDLWVPASGANPRGESRRMIGLSGSLAGVATLAALWSWRRNTATGKTEKKP